MKVGNHKKRVGMMPNCLVLDDFMKSEVLLYLKLMISDFDMITISFYQNKQFGVIMRLLLVSVLGFSLFLTSCVSMKDYEQLKNDYDAYKSSSESQIKDLKNQLVMFINNYDPKLHEVLTNNLDISSKYFENIKAINSNIAALQKSIEEYALLSEKAKEKTIENSLTSESRNVVSEFNSLKDNWLKKLSEFNTIMISTQQNAINAQSASIDISKKVSLIQNWLDKIDDISSDIDRIEKEITRINSSQSTMNQDIIQIKKTLLSIQKDIDTLKGSN